MLDTTYDSSPSEELVSETIAESMTDTNFFEDSVLDLEVSKDNQIGTVNAELEKLNDKLEQLALVLENFPNKQEIDELKNNQQAIVASLEEEKENIKETFQFQNQLLQKLLRLQDINHQLHDELSHYKQGLFEEYRLPILKSLWKFRRTVETDARYAIEETLRSTLESYLEDIDDIFTDFDLEIFSSEVGETFNPATDRQNNVVETTDELLAWQIVTNKGAGLRLGNKVIDKRIVDVYKLVQNKTENGEV